MDRGRCGEDAVGIDDRGYLIDYNYMNVSKMMKPYVSEQEKDIDTIQYNTHLGWRWSSLGSAM